LASFFFFTAADDIAPVDCGEMRVASRDADLAGDHDAGG
jgi:hypothetical protein